MSVEGRLLGGRYDVGAPIGRGGMAEVHLGQDIRLGRTVAIKVLRSDLARDPQFLTRFRREAQSAAGLTHPSIVAIYDSGQDESAGADGSVAVTPYIVMEYVEGQTLRHHLTGDQRFPPDEAARIAQGVLDALAYSHRMGIVHRDIKPGNVMISRTGQVKVMDFGIARAVADAEATRTQTQAVMGTAQYLSPEQALGQPVDARTDLYSTGCLLFELLTGRPPFVADTAVALAYQHVGQTPTPPSAVVPSIPPAYDAIVLHALVKERDTRYQSAEEFRADLAAARSRVPVSAAAQETAAAYALDHEAISGPPPRSTRHDDPVTSSLPAIDTEAQHAKRKGRRAAYIGLGVAVTVGLALLAYLFASGTWRDPAQQTAAVPYVVGMAKDDAISLITARGLTPKAVPAADDNVERDIVIKQNPSKDVKISAGGTVTITVSTGPSKVVIPDVVGATSDSAQQTLELSNIGVSRVDLVDDPAQDKGHVIATDPPIGSTVDAGAQVVLKVASGKVRVPDLITDDRAAAAAELATVGLVLDPTFVEDGEVTPDSITAQDPSAGELVEVGTSVKVTVAKAPPPPVETVTVPVPDPSAGG